MSFKNWKFYHFKKEHRNFEYKKLNSFLIRENDFQIANGILFSQTDTYFHVVVDHMMLYLSDSKLYHNFKSKTPKEN